MILAVARTHLARLRRDRAGFTLAFIVPIVFFSVFALLFGGPRGSTRRIPVAVVDEDGSETSRRFVSALGAEAGLKIQTSRIVKGREGMSPYDRPTAENAVREGEVSLALVIPAGFGEHPIQFGASGGAPRLLLLSDSADPVAPQVLAGLLQKVALTALPDALATAGISQMDLWGASLTEEQRTRLRDSLQGLRERAGAGAGAGGARSAGGLVAVEVRDVLGESKKNPASALLAAGLGVMFLLFSAAGAGGALIEEAESGTLDRILGTRVTMTQLLLGKLLYLSSVAVAQLFVMFTWGQIFFGVELFRHLPGFFLMTAVTAIACSSFGLVLAAASKTRIQLVALSNLLILVMSALGGSMVPRYLLSETIQKLGLITLNAWAIDGFLKVFWREEPLWRLWPQVLVLLVAAVALFAVARRLAHRWDEA
ncbi:MAG TPA: ABC transporter permease [Thermoanaerobaculia bacterium]|nr:ABC transporter permease [Thermoanaerobaculia bacterium]